MLKKKSLGPTIGAPSKRSLQLFFLASYNVDGFRRFVLSEGFQNAYDLDAETLEAVRADDVAAMQFGFRFLKQILFGEDSIPAKGAEA